MKTEKTKVKVRMFFCSQCGEDMRPEYKEMTGQELTEQKWKALHKVCNDCLFETRKGELS